MLDDPVRTMFARYQQRFFEQGRKRLSYPKEYKLAAIQRVKSGNTRYRVAKDLNITEAMLAKWIIKNSDILAMKKGGRRAISGRQVKYSLLEDLLKIEFSELRELGRPVFRRWFIAKAKTLFKKLYPQLTTISPSGKVSYGGFKFSRSWFRGFLKRQHISLRKRTNQEQKQPEEYREAIQSFHQFIRYMAEPRDYEIPQDVGRFKLRHIANMDQTPMPFKMGTDLTYNETGARTVWVKSLGSGLDKRQATVQLTVHADGIAQTPPMIVF